jgi:predicted Rossmann fold nucleotide-binding protein DprA/Smf involved in DNA uptake
VRAAAQQRLQFAVLGLAQLDPVAYSHRGLLGGGRDESTDESQIRRRSVPHAQNFTDKQGQYLAFIHAYSRMVRRPPAEADLQRHFGVSPPSVHQMVLTLERRGLIKRQPGVPRSIELLVAPEHLPVLK